MESYPTNYRIALPLSKCLSNLLDRNKNPTLQGLCFRLIPILIRSPFPYFSSEIGLEKTIFSILPGVVEVQAEYCKKNYPVSEFQENCEKSGSR